MGKYLLAHDLGTSGNKATLFSTEGQLIASCTYNYDVYYSNNNWAEQNPNDWWQAVIATTKTLIKNINPKDILAVSFSGQMMGCVCVDKKTRTTKKCYYLGRYAGYKSNSTNS